MARLADLWTEFRTGKPLKSVAASVPYIRFSKDDPHYGGDCLYDENECYDQYFSIELHWMDEDDWELVPEPTRVADYLVPAKVATMGSFDNKISVVYAMVKSWYAHETHPIGQQPEGSVMIIGSERDSNDTNKGDSDEKVD